MRHRKFAVSAVAAIALLTTACAPLPTEGDALPGSDSAPVGEAAQTVDTSALTPYADPIPSCNDIGTALGSLIEGYQPKPSDFERRGFQSGMETLSCKWVNAEFVSKADGKVFIGVTVSADKINKAAYEGNTEGAADLIIAGSPVEAAGAGSFAIAAPLALTDPVTKEGLITVGEGIKIETSVTADEGAAPTTQQVLDAHAALLGTL